MALDCWALKKQDSDLGQGNPRPAEIHQHTVHDRNGPIRREKTPSARTDRYPVAGGCLHRIDPLKQVTILRSENCYPKSFLSPVWRVSPSLLSADTHYQRTRHLRLPGIYHALNRYAALLCIRAEHGSDVAVRHTVLLLHRHRQEGVRYCRRFDSLP